MWVQFVGHHIEEQLQGEGYDQVQLFHWLHHPIHCVSTIFWIQNNHLPWNDRVWLSQLASSHGRKPSGSKPGPAHHAAAAPSYVLPRCSPSSDSKCLASDTMIPRTGTCGGWPLLVISWEILQFLEVPGKMLALRYDKYEDLIGFSENHMGSQFGSGLTMDRKRKVWWIVQLCLFHLCLVGFLLLQAPKWCAEVTNIPVK